MTSAAAMKPAPKPATVLRASVVATLLMAASGCAMISPVQPWEKGTLAKPEMSFEGDSLEMKFSEHIYTSREAASGGTGVGGGGCGCN